MWVRIPPAPQPHIIRCAILQQEGWQLVAGQQRVIRTKKAASESASSPKKMPSNATAAGNAYIPDTSVYASYVGRKVNGVQDLELLEYAMDRGHNVMLSGPTGSGKTRLGESFAAWKGLPYYSLPCDVSIDPSALFGKMVPTEDAGRFEWADGPVTELARNGGVLNISEVNFMSPKIAASLYPLLDSRRQIPLLANRGEIVRPGRGELLIVADMNPNYRGTQILNAAFLNRFPLKIVWDYDDAVEKSLVGSASLRELAKKIRAMLGKEIRTPVSTNALVETVQFARDFGAKFALANFVAGFEPGEQDAIQKLTDLSSKEIERDIAALKSVSASTPSDEDEDVDWDYDLDLGSEDSGDSSDEYDITL